MSGNARGKTRRAFLAANPWCHYCGWLSETIDHIIPRSIGGRNTRWNYVASCKICNQRRGNDFPTCRCQRCCNALALAVVSNLVPAQLQMEISDWWNQSDETVDVRSNLL